MRTRLTLTVGKLVRRLAKLRGGGSALPGLVVERLDPGFMARTLGRLPHGIIVVSGTNGKTTTTKMIAELLSGSGLRVFTNRTGSNFTRGVTAALVAELPLSGRLDADVAVLELDEAHAVHFVRAVAPRHSVILNVLRDQLDRFGEIDTTAALLARIVERTAGTVVLNREDPLVRALADRAPAGSSVRYFGLAEDLLRLFPSDDDLHGVRGPTEGVAAQPERRRPAADVTLVSARGQEAGFEIDGASYETSVKLEGVYNLFNAAAALTVARAVLGSAAEPARLVALLSAVEPAFGRGERILVDGVAVDLVLVKNPSGFRLALASFDAAATRTMIAINDQDADGRDMSWLWDVDFTSLGGEGVALVSGIRADDMALRLDYDEVPVGEVIPDLGAALGRLLAGARGDGGARPCRVYCTYTAMLELRRHLARRADLMEVW